VGLSDSGKAVTQTTRKGGSYTGNLAGRIFNDFKERNFTRWTASNGKIGGGALSITSRRKEPSLPQGLGEKKTKGEKKESQEIPS